LEAQDAKRLIVGTGKIVAAKAGVQSAKSLPIRGRENSTSCALFVRPTELMYKRVLTICRPGTSITYKVEFLAQGQQVVVAGMHESGARVRSSLPQFGLQGVPEIAALAESLGYEVGAKGSRPPKAVTGPYKPDEAVTREIMRRRAEWVPHVVPCTPGKPDREWRVSSAELNRELEEDLSIYPDGIYDYGTERSHGIASLICEFGAIDDHSEISFGGCPEYGRNGKEEFAVIGEPDAVCRPSEAEALTWLCRTLGGPGFPVLPPDARWATALPVLAAAVGLDWSALEQLRASRYFEPIDGSDTTVFDPTSWSAEELQEKRRLVPALRATDPVLFATAEFAWDVTGAAGTAELAQIFADEAQRLREWVASAPDTALLEPSLAAQPSDTWGEPQDVFGDGEPERLLELPKGSLPSVIEDFARDLSERMGVPTAFAASAAIATVSAAIGSKLRIQPLSRDTSWTEPGFLWFAIIEDPGGKKSPVISAATAPLAKLDAELAKEDSRIYSEWRERKSSRKKGDQDPGPEPRIRRHLVEGFTMEALTAVLKDNPGGVLVRQDELTQLVGALDAYKANKGGDRPMLLSLFDGRETRSDRAGRGLLYVECWGASVIGGIQPKKIREIAGGLDADGLLQRFIPILGDGVRRPNQDREPNAAALRRYSDIVREIAKAEYVFPDTIRLSDDAQVVWKPLSERISLLAALPDLSDAWRGHLGNWPGFSNRLLLLCHVIEHWASSNVMVHGVPVSAATAQRAVRLVEWLLGQSLRFYEECIGVGEAGEDARWIAGYILASDRSGKIKRRDIGQTRKGLRDEARCVRAMRYLEQMNWCAADFSERVDKHGPSRWHINPVVFDGRFAPRKESERIRRENQRAEIAAASAERARIKQGEPHVA
jgi:hypothetical protein